MNSKLHTTSANAHKQKHTNLTVPNPKHRSSSADRNPQGYYYEDLTVESTPPSSLKTNGYGSSLSNGYTSDTEGVSGFRARVKSGQLGTHKEKKAVRFSSPVHRVSNSRGSGRGGKSREPPTNYYRRW